MLLQRKLAVFNDTFTYIKILAAMSTPSLIPAITTTSENTHTIGTASTTVNTTASQNVTTLNTMHHISSVSSVISTTTSVSSMTQSWKGMLKYKIGGTVFITF